MGTAGDVDNDGLEDLIITSLKADGTGETYLVFAGFLGSQKGLPDNSIQLNYVEFD